MPNQRAAGLRVVGVYISEQEHRNLDWLAKKAGVSKAVYVRRLIKRMMDEATTADQTKKPRTNNTNNKPKTEQ